MKLFEQWRKLGEAVLEMPFAAARSLLAPERGVEQTLSAAGWKVYDAWIRVVNESTNNLLRNPEIGASMGRAMEASLRWQQLGSSSSGAFFAALWPAVGLPSAAELTELRAEVGALRDELAAARLEAQEARAAEIEADDRRDAGGPPSALWSGGWNPATAVPFASERGEDEPAN